MFDAAVFGMFDAAVSADDSRRKAIHNLRRLFFHTQSNFYHIHNAFDYNRDGILSANEWQTWKGLIREMNAHPMLLTVIWQGYQNRYFSRNYAQFLQAELYSETIPADVADSEVYKRNKEFVLYFYPEMTKQGWPDVLPEY